MSSSASTSEMDRINGLPRQIIMDEILTRLPVKSLCWFKTVSKSWNAVISSHQFAKAHLKTQLGSTSNDYNSKWVFFQQKGCSFLLNYEAYDDNDPTENQRVIDSEQGLLPLGEVLDRDINEGEEYPVGSSCGLVCFLTKLPGQLCLCNPILRQCRTISGPHQFERKEIIFIGFGYVSSIDDFKIVLGLRGKMVGETDAIHVFSLREKEWRTIERGNHFDIIATSRLYIIGTLVDEHLHWWTLPIGDSNGGRIIAFDLLHEVFEEIPIPEPLPSLVPYMLRLAHSTGLCVMEGCLTLSVHWLHYYMEIWILKQYGNFDSWVKKHVFRIQPNHKYNCIELYGFTKTGKLLISCGERPYYMIFCLVDPNHKGSDDEVSTRELECFMDGGPSVAVNYVMSLVSPFSTATPLPPGKEGDGDGNIDEEARNH